MQRQIIDKRYKVLKKLGTGAMGEVYKVRNLRDNSIIALKILSKEKSSSESVQRFKREFKLLAGLHHPNLCAVYDFGTLKDGRSYFTMEYVDGKDIFNASKGLPHAQIYSWIVQFCRVLEYIHSKGLVHYDIKPGNVLIQMTEDITQSTVKLTDFGLAGEQSITGGNLIKGTLPYIAPEVIEGLAVDHRADLYSLGVVLYEMFTRKSFYTEDKDSFATLIKQRKERGSSMPSKRSSKILGKLERLMSKLLAFEHSERFNRANEVIKEINKLSRSKFELETEKTLEGYLLSSKFVGREKEMHLLTSFYEQACKGESKVILITGDAGIGKSRLLHEFKLFIQLERIHCFLGATSKNKPSALEPFYTIFRELINYLHDSSILSRELRFSLAVLFKMFPDLPDGHFRRNLPKLVPLNPESEKLRTFEALSELIGHFALNLGELVILLEDLHWADDLTIQFLEYLGRNLGSRHIFVCGTYRQENVLNNSVFLTMVTNLKKQEYLNQIELKSLNFKNLYSLLDSTITPPSNSIELTQYLMKVTDGNPLFVEEIMRTLFKKRTILIGEMIDVDDLKHLSTPKTINDAVFNRIKDLDSNSQQILKFAAILLKDSNYDLLKQLTRMDNTTLSQTLWELKRKQILIEENNQFRFYHTIMREAINDRMTSREKRTYYYHTGKIIERIYKKNSQKVVEELAYYFINAKNIKRGLKYGLNAARKSSEKYNNEQAFRFYKNILKLLGNKPHKLRFDILRELAHNAFSIGSYGDSIKYYETALCIKNVTTEKKIKVLLGIGAVYTRRGEYRKAIPVYKNALHIVEKIRSVRLKKLLTAYISANLWGSYVQAGDFKNAKRFNFKNLKLSHNLNDKEAISYQAKIYHIIGLVESNIVRHGFGNYEKVISYYKKAKQYYKKIKYEYEIAGVLNNLGNIYLNKYNFSKAFDYYQKAFKISQNIGDPYAMALELCNFGGIQKHKGHYPKALDYLRKALAISEKIGNTVLIGVSIMEHGDCFLRMCNYKKAKEYFERSLKIFNTLGWKETQVRMFIYAGNIHQILGNYTLALRFYEKASKISRNIKNKFHMSELSNNIGKVFCEIGLLSKATTYLMGALKVATECEYKDIMIDCYLSLCLMNIIIKNYDLANEYFEKGIEVSKKLGMRRESLQFYLFISMIYYHTKKYSKGIKITNRVIKMATEMGTKDLHAEALLCKAKNGIHGILSKIEVNNLLLEALRITEEIKYPEILWKVYYEYGQFLQKDKKYLEAIEYYQKCNNIFKKVGSKIKNESYRQSYLHRPDREAVMIAAKEINKLLD